MWWEVKNNTLGGDLESIMKGVSDVSNGDGEVVRSRKGDNQTECR